MSTLVYMKLLEQSPEKYDRGMQFITLGRIDLLKEKIANHAIHDGDKVLEIGCGTGSLAAKMTERGADVTAIDISPMMLQFAQKAAPNAKFIHMTASEIDHFQAGSFNRIVAMLSLSEMAPLEVQFTLQQSARLLSNGGQLIIVDEIRPRSLLQWISYILVRVPLALFTFLLTQTTTRALPNLHQQVKKAGFSVLLEEHLLFGSLTMIIAEKK